MSKPKPKGKQRGIMRICGRNVSVMIGDNHAWDSDSMGRSSIVKGAIHLSDDLDVEGQRSVLLHEVIHFVADSMDLNLTEKQVAGLEVGLLAALRDNEVWTRGFIEARNA